MGYTLTVTPTANVKEGVIAVQPALLAFESTMAVGTSWQNIFKATIDFDYIDKIRWRVTTFADAGDIRFDYDGTPSDSPLANATATYGVEDTSAKTGNIELTIAVKMDTAQHIGNVLILAVDD